MIKKETFITGFIVCVPIIIIVYVMSLFSLSQTWPAFFVVLFYALGGYQLKNLKSIFAGGVTGILMAFCVSLVVPLLAPIIGGLPAGLLVAFVALYLLLILGDLVPVMFNMYAFAYYMVTAAMTPQQPPLVLVGTLIIGGAVFTATCIGLLVLLLKSPPADFKTSKTIEVK